MTVRALLFSIGLATLGTAALRAQPASTPAPAQPQPRVTVPAPAAAQPQQRTPPPAPAAAPQQPPRDLVRPEGQPLNIKVDVTITDQRGNTAASKKTVSVVTADGLGSFIRSQATYFNLGDIPLNVDTEPRLLTDGKIRLRVNLQYELPGQSASSTGQVELPREVTLRKTSIHENLSLILENGKPIIAAQSADPVSDRQVTIEVKATVLR